MMRWLGERHHRSVRERHSEQRGARCFHSFPPVCDQFNARRGILSRWSAVFACLRGVRPASQRDQRRSGTAAPAEERAVTPVPKPRRLAAAPRPRVLTAGPVIVGSSTVAKEPHITVPRRTKMATTATTTPSQPVTYALLIIFTVDARTHDHLQDHRPSATTPKAGSRASTPRFTASTFAKPANRRQPERSKALRRSLDSTSARARVLPTRSRVPASVDS